MLRRSLGASQGNGVIGALRHPLADTASDCAVVHTRTQDPTLQSLVYCGLTDPGRQPITSLLVGLRLRSGRHFCFQAGILETRQDD